MTQALAKPVEQQAPQQPVVFRLETPVVPEEMIRLFKDLLPLREENFAEGYGKKGCAFEPDFELITKITAAGGMRWILARRGDEVVGLQQWTFVHHLWSARTKLAVCESIIGGRKRGIDIEAFVQYGMAAMKAIGATHIYFMPAVGSSFQKVLEKLGGKAEGIIMEMP